MDSSQHLEAITGDDVPRRPYVWKAPPYPGRLKRLWGLFWCLLALIVGTIWCIGRDVRRWFQNFDLGDTEGWIDEVWRHVRIVTSKRAWVRHHWEADARHIAPVGQCEPPHEDTQP